MGLLAVKCQGCGSTDVEPELKVALCDTCFYDEYNYCESCEDHVDKRELNEGYCETCYEEHYCECGQKLEDSAGQPGDGFCIMCR